VSAVVSAAADGQELGMVQEAIENGPLSVLSSSPNG